MNTLSKLLIGSMLLIAVFFVVRTAAFTDSSAAAATAPQSTPAQRAKAAECGDALDKGHAAWHSMSQDGDVVTVEAGPMFSQVDYSAREAFTALTVCYYTQGRMDDAVKVVEFLDPYTHQSLGHWYKGVGLSFDR
jgi:hypothetical protein